MQTAAYLRSFFDQLFLPNCLLCKQSSQRKQPLCPGCEQDLIWLEHYCLQCAEPLAHSNAAPQRCGKCLKRPPAFTHCFAPLRYEFPINLLIQRYKARADITLVDLLSQLFMQRWHLSALSNEPPELLLPVPLHSKRLHQRGFNQSLELADRLGKRLGIEVNNKACSRVIDTPHQIGLDAKQRRRNLKHAFQVDAAQLAGIKHLALVDDVMTTGTTAGILAQALVRSGVERVDVWCLARTPSGRGKNSYA